MEIKINIDLGINAELKKIVEALFFSGNIQTAVMPESTTKKAVVEHTAKPRKHEAEPATVPVATEKKVEAATPTVDEKKSAITLPDLRTEVKRLYDGGKHKEELPIIFKNFGVKNVTEVHEDKYQELYDALTAKSKELGL